MRVKKALIVSLVLAVAFSICATFMRYQDTLLANDHFVAESAELAKALISLAAIDKNKLLTPAELVAKYLNKYSRADELSEVEPEQKRKEYLDYEWIDVGVVGKDFSQEELNKMVDDSKRKIKEETEVIHKEVLKFKRVPLQESLIFGGLVFVVVMPTAFICYLLLGLAWIKLLFLINQFSLAAQGKHQK